MKTTKVKPEFICEMVNTFICGNRKDAKEMFLKLTKEQKKAVCRELYTDWAAFVYDYFFNLI